MNWKYICHIETCPSYAGADYLNSYYNYILNMSQHEAETAKLKAKLDDILNEKYRITRIPKVKTEDTIADAERMEKDKMDKTEGFKTINFITEEGRVRAHMYILEQLNELYEKKNHDYGDSFHKTFMEEGFSMSRIRLTDKLERFKNLSHDPSTSEVKTESIRDTLMDLANYAVMTVLEMDRLKDDKWV